MEIMLLSIRKGGGIMFKKLFTVGIIGAISFVAGSYYTMANPSTNLYVWNKKNVELFSSTPANISSAFEDIKFVFSTSIELIDNKIEKLFTPDHEEPKIIETDQFNHDNPSTDDLKNINVDHEEKDILPASGGIGI